MSPEFQEWNERRISYHLRSLYCAFYSGYLNEDCTTNMDETHFIYDLDSTLAWQKEDEKLTTKIL